MLSHDGSSSAPLLPATACPDVCDGQQAWRQKGHGHRGRGLSKRARLAIGGVVAVCTLTGMLTWAATRIAAAPRVAVTLLGTDYRSNLNLPPNGLGDRSLGRLAAWATGGEADASRHVYLQQAPIEFRAAADIDAITPDPQAAVAVVFVAAHGVSTADGPALLPADANRLEDAVPVRTLLSRLARFPDHQQKVLLLDCVHFQSLPSQGLLLNGFAHQMRDLNEEIAAIPNLVVVMSCDVDQQSWIHPAEGTTNWAAWLIQALSGAAEDTNRDGWIDLRDVHLTTARQTRDWARRVCGRQQTPLVLPLGDSGVARSRQMGLFPAQNAPSAAAPMIFATRSDEIAHWWQRHQAYQESPLPPAVRTPVLWRRFEALLQRFEHFEMAGCRDAADTCADRLDRLAAQLDRATVVDSVACQAGLIAPEVVGFADADRVTTNAAQLVALLSEMPAEKAADDWQSLVHRQPNLESVASLRRAMVEQQTRQIAASLRDPDGADGQRIARAAALMQTIADPLQPLPQSAVLLQLVARDMPIDALTPQDAMRIARWLELSLRSDRVAADNPWWDPRLYRWAESLLDTADQNRRLAGDLLFGDPDARRRSDRYLSDAETAYDAVEGIAAVVASAESVRRLGEHQLRRVRKLLIDRQWSSRDADGSRDAIAVETLYRTLDQIDDLLDAGAPTADAQRQESLQRLETAVNQFREQLRRLRQDVDQWQLHALGDATRDLPERLAALRTVGGSADARIGAWTNLCQMAVSTATPRHAIVDAKDKTAWVRRAAATCGRLTLAAWPAADFDDAAAHAETWAQVVHRLELLAVESQWRRSLAEAGAQIAARADALSPPSVVAERRTPGGRGAGTDLQSGRAATIALRIGAVPAADAAHEMIAQRRADCAAYFAWQADRFRADAYWGVDDAKDPYFGQAAALLEMDVASSNSQPFAEVTRSSARPASVDFQAPERLIWTTQLSEQIEVRPRSDRHDGFVAIRIAGRGRMRITHPEPNQPVCRPLVVNHLETNPAAPAAVDALLVGVELDAAPATEPPAVDVFGYFRGHQLHQRIDVEFASQPDVSYASLPVSPGGRIAVRSADSRDGGGGGAVTLVLDCSGSMGAARGETFGPDTKYAQAVAAVETLLDQLPSGTRVSIWAFGQATGPHKTVEPAERSIRRIQDPLTWDADDRGLREALIAAIRYPNLEPWNQSPLMATMIAAAGDLQQQPGPRSLIVITDGADNRVATDTATNPLGLTPQELLTKHFSGTGITVNVIAFRVDADEQDSARRQLGTVEQLLPPGRFIQTDQAAELAAALRQMLIVPPSIRLHPVVDDSQSAADAAQSVAVSPPTGAASWTPRLRSGLYRITGGDAPVDGLVHLQDGDQLTLERSSLGILRPWPVVQRQYQWCPRRQSGRWIMALAPTAPSNVDGSAYHLVLSTTDATGPLAVQRPAELWMQARDDQGRPLPVHWQPNADLPGAVYSVQIAHPAEIQPTLQVWIGDRPAGAVGTLVRGRDFENLTDLAPVVWQLSDGQAHLRSATVEMHPVMDSQGTVSLQPCLVLRAAVPPGDRFRLRTEGIAFDGQDEQCFIELGRVTLRQWPVSAAGAQRSLKAVHLISIDQFDRELTRSAGSVTFAAHGGSGPPTPTLTEQLTQARVE